MLETFTPLLPQPVEHPGRKVHTCDKGQKGRSYFKFCTLVGRFWSDGAASMAAKGLTQQQEPIAQYFTDMGEHTALYKIYKNVYLKRQK